MNIISIILFIVYIYLFFNVIYLLLFSIAGIFRKQPHYGAHPIKRRIAILIPAYEEDSVIIRTAQEAINHNYPSNNFDVIIIADSLKPETIARLSEMPLRIINVSFKNSTKAKSLKFALSILPSDFEIALILDADNIMGPGCLEKINTAFNQGFRMVQLHRTAKNKNTATAVMDALSEETNNHIFRTGHRALRISSALIGSGMAFDFRQFATLMMQTDIENNPGEDREIYLEMLKKGEVCEYIEDALVFDEKVQTNAILEKQRTRWLSAQLQYTKRFWVTSITSTFSYNIHYFDYAIQTLLLPRILLLVLSLFMAMIATLCQVIIQMGLFPGIAWWLFIPFGAAVSIIISGHQIITTREFANSLKNLPKIFWSFSKAILNSKATNREFIRTPKGFINDQL